MRDVIGLAFHEDRIDGAVIRRRPGSMRVLATFSVSMDEHAEGALRAKLRELGVRTRGVHVGIPRRRAAVKVIELPMVTGADLRRMVGFELERHLPFPPVDAVFDFHVLDQSPGRPVRVLLVAAERRVFERVEELLRKAGLVPRLVDVTIHSLAMLVAQGAGAQPQEGRVVVHLTDGEAELAIVRDGHPILSRAFPLPSDPEERGHALATELRRTLASLTSEDREVVADATVLGDVTLPTDWLDLPTHTSVRLPPGVSGNAGNPVFFPALAMALRVPRRGVLRTSLMPNELRPRPFPWPMALTAGLAAVALLLALAIPARTAIRDERALTGLTRKVDALAPAVREVEQLVSAIERERREVEILRSFQMQHVRALPVLRELTELLPPDAWLTNLTVERKGIELSGFAATASQLIPLLEASPTFERVEFTSPVTKGRDREQFRLQATWEQPPGAPPEAAVPASGKPARPGAAAPLEGTR